ncbi:hypothetical protein Hanom_Chr06g00491541 [Helianthus anomalus]
MHLISSNRAISISFGLRMSSVIAHSNVVDTVSVPATNKSYNNLGNDYLRFNLHTYI